MALEIDPFAILDAQNDQEDKEESLAPGCAHESIYRESEHKSYCLDCGLEVQSDLSQEKDWKTFSKEVDTSRGYTSVTKYKNIYDEIKHMNFPANIVDSADALFKLVTQKMAEKLKKPSFNFKGLMRKAVILACIYESFKKLAPTAISLPRLVEIFAPLNRKKAFVGIKILRLKNKLVQSRCITPLDFVRDVLDKFANDIDQSEIREIYSQIENRSESLNRSWHYSVAAGLVYYYALLKKKDICLKEYAQRIKLSEFTIQKNAKEISSILGTPEILPYEKIS